MINLISIGLLRLENATRKLWGCICRSEYNGEKEMNILTWAWFIELRVQVMALCYLQEGFSGVMVRPPEPSSPSGPWDTADCWDAHSSQGMWDSREPVRLQSWPDKSVGRAGSLLTRTASLWYICTIYLHLVSRLRDSSGAPRGTSTHASLGHSKSLSPKMDHTWYRYWAELFLKDSGPHP